MYFFFGYLIREERQILILENLYYSINGFELVADFEVPRGSKVAVIGPSGAGKSTLLSLIAGFVSPNRGKIIIDNQDVSKQKPNKRSVTSIFQDGNLFPHLTVEQNIGLGIRPDLKLNDSQLEILNKAIIRVGLSGFAKRSPGTLSGGQQSRVSLARSLVRDQPILLLDEPFSALGPSLKYDMLNLVNEIADEKKLTLLFVSHEPQDVKKICDLSIVVGDGCVFSPVETGKLFENPPNVLKDYL